MGLRIPLGYQAEIGNQDMRTVMALQGPGLERQWWPWWNLNRALRTSDGAIAREDTVRCCTLSVTTIYIINSITAITISSLRAAVDNRKRHSRLGLLMIAPRRG